MNITVTPEMAMPFIIGILLGWFCMWIYFWFRKDFIYHKGLNDGADRLYNELKNKPLQSTKTL